MRALQALIVIAVLACLTPAAATENECTAETAVKLENRTEENESVRLKFLVDITTEESCSEITYDVVLDLKLPNGQWKSVRLSRQTEVQGGSSSQTVEHTMADLELLEFRAETISCNRCAALISDAD